MCSADSRISAPDFSYSACLPLAFVFVFVIVAFLFERCVDISSCLLDPLNTEETGVPGMIESEKII